MFAFDIPIDFTGRLLFINENMKYIFEFLI